MKRCTTCGVSKPTTEFHNKASMYDGKNCQCKACVRACNSAWRSAHPEKVKILWDRWRKKHPQVVSALKKKSREKDPIKAKRQNDIRVARWKLKFPGRAQAMVTKWKQANRGRVNAMCKKREAHKNKACPPWANHFFIEEIYDLAQLRTKATGFKWDVDHIIPLRHKLFCGLHVEYNLQVIPHLDNMRKGNRVPPELLGASIGC